MSICLSRIRFTEADHPNASLGFGETQYVQPTIQVAQRDVTGFAICLSSVREHLRSIEIDVCCSFKRELALSDVPLVLDRIKVDVHELKCMYK